MNVDTGPTVDLDAFDAEIIRIAQIRFDKNEPALINALGIQLGPKLAQVKAQTGLSFLQYLQERLNDRFDIIPVKPNTPGLWPKGMPYEDAVSAYGQRPRPQGPRRYVRWFWNAFAEPLAQGRRFFDPTERRIRDADAPEAASWIEIPTHLIRAADGVRSVRDIHQHIEEWLKEQGLAADTFIEEAAPLRAPSGTVRSVLDALIESLTSRQLQSVTMPLDVVAELAKRRV